MNLEFTYPLCSGENCGRKSICRRFKRDLNKLKEDHFNKPPLKEDGSCNWFEQKHIDPFIEKLRELLNDKDKDGS